MPYENKMGQFVVFVQEGARVICTPLEYYEDDLAAVMSALREQYGNNITCVGKGGHNLLTIPDIFWIRVMISKIDYAIVQKVEGDSAPDEGGGGFRK